MLIKPIDFAQQCIVSERTNALIKLAGGILAVDFQCIPVAYDLKGRAAGEYQVHRGKRRIRYNPFLFAKYFQENLAHTVPHEVAHYLCDHIYGITTIRPHGPEWRAVMELFNAPAKSTHAYNLEGIPTRSERLFHYTCSCREHFITCRRHRSIQSAKAIYHCKKCGNEIRFKNTKNTDS